MHQAWVRFILQGDPNHEGIPAWRKYQTNDRAILVIGADAVHVVNDMSDPALCAAG
jgi:carboxylesterase type B